MKYIAFIPVFVSVFPQWIVMCGCLLKLKTDAQIDGSGCKEMVFHVKNCVQGIHRQITQSANENHNN